MHLRVAVRRRRRLRGAVTTGRKHRGGGRKEVQQSFLHTSYSRVSRVLARSGTIGVCRHERDSRRVFVYTNVNALVYSEARGDDGEGRVKRHTNGDGGVDVRRVA